MEAFNELYHLGLNFAFGVSVWASALACLLFLRPVYAYAKALPLDEKEDGPLAGSFLLLVLLRAMANFEVWIDSDDGEYVTWEEFRNHLNYHPLGPMFDVLVAFLFPLVIGITWPGLLFILVTAAPIQVLHVKNKKKREFIERLKGEKGEE